MGGGGGGGGGGKSFSVLPHSEVNDLVDDVHRGRKDEFLDHPHLA